MYGKESAEARLKELARAIVSEVDIPTEDSDVALYQAFTKFGFKEPHRQEVSFKAILDDFGILGWMLAWVFRGKVKLLLERLDQEANYNLSVYRDEENRLWNEVHFRDSLIREAVREKQRAQWEAQEEGRKIRDRSSRSATKTRNTTVDQLRQLLKPAKIRLLEQQLEVAQRMQISEEVQKLQEALTSAFNDALKEFGDIATVVEKLAEFDVLMAMTPKPKKS